MCGLVGFLRSRELWGEAQASSVLERMAGAITHRGPDDQGLWLDPARGVGLGHRRLSIVDLSPGGHQPMISHGGHHVIVFNGEIYNHTELRSELEALGCRFQSSSDTEVLLEAIVQWGVAATCRKLVGMFAFAVWDKAEATLWLARDRLGKKPLYLFQDHQGYAFASELKAFWHIPGFAPSLNLDAVAEYFRFTYVPDDLSIFNEVIKLMPGTLAEIRPGAAMRTHAYWSLEEVAVSGREARIPDLRAAEESLLPLLRDATGRRMLADVPLGAFLSGGIDSGLVVSLMQENSLRKVRTFSIGFDESSHDEAPVARAVARHLGTDHTELYVTAADAQELVPRMPEIFDEPFADASQIPTYLLSTLTRAHVTVALTGDGGDESFGGYARYRNEYGLLGACYRLPRPVRSALARGVTGIPSGVWDAASALLPNRIRPRFLGAKVGKVSRALMLESPALRGKAFLSFWDRKEIMRRPVLPEREDSFACPEQLLDEPSEAMQYWETRHYLSGDLLTKVDRATMAASLEARCPLLDHRVVELAWRLPADLKASDVALKRILRSLLFRYVPREIIDLPKQGFSVPIGPWMVSGLRVWVDDMLDYGRCHTADILNWQNIDAAWSDLRAGRVGQVEKLWAVVMFCAWHRRWMSAPTGAGPAN
ncbi:MAG: asparagine synthase (glutamine-hydrolyzing) [Rhodocyclaceae bacterium]|nr:asparagine synthase (glutamine-hydrolyzing) [Rhodocyclaceae bacterium]